MRPGDQIVIVCQVIDAGEHSYTLAIQATAFSGGAAGMTITDVGLVVKADRDQK